MPATQDAILRLVNAQLTVDFVFDRNPQRATLHLLPEAGRTTLPVFAEATTASVCHPFSGAKTKRVPMFKTRGSGRQMPM
jgi:hypothetical protein